MRDRSADSRRLFLIPGFPAGQGGLAAAVFALASVVSLAHLAGLSTLVFPDTASYFTTLGELFSRRPNDPALRTPFYPLVLAAANALAHSGHAVVALQILGRAFACSYAAAVLAERHRGAGTLVGILLAIDTASATNSVTYLPESFYTTGQVLSLALVVRLAPRAAVLRRRDLLLAGAACGAMLMIRPTGWVFLPALVFGFAWALRSLRRALPVVAGFLAVMLGIVLFNGARSGYYGVARSGVYLAFPLFTQGLFHPENGPASSELAAILAECRPDLDLRGTTVVQANAFVHGGIAPCLSARFGGANEASSTILRTAYAEALLARPRAFASRMIAETLLFLYWTAPHHALQCADLALAPATAAFCAADAGSSALGRFVCPLPAPAPAVRRALIGLSLALRPVYQPYAALRRFASSSLSRAGVVLLGYWALVLLAAPRGLRLPVVLAVLLLATNAAATAAGQVTLPRYVSVGAPLHLVISGIAAAALASRGRAWLARQRLRTPPGSAA